MKNINEIRNIFISYFIKKKHFLAKSSSLISNTKDLLFTNSGMNQFKFFFYNNNNIKYKKLVNCQRCLRVGGKYNDLNNIGFSNKHNTFFEMLGNFSFNDYFKEESIYMA
ncbi:alanine--tRNA ligase-related protein [Candidatus Nardonella dryophthoridicola]|uniref:Alanine--tRNA ligase n=1 Tax=endosymbiont of Metamasius hemipterus TaxID=204627 RepID=A0ABT0TWG9_9GAMM|nr:alanine--tRNA ligase-related protein [Candidatus Nardonella dryophthoridicola]MCM0158219.1 alanine--tRNA ligase-related protein [endosymbiont of Metamasius hemipterus]